MTQNDEEVAEQTIQSLQQLAKEKINSETAKIKWSELQRYFAAGKVYQVMNELDLVDAAHACSVDDTKKVVAWKQQKLIALVSDEQAAAWVASDSFVWTVVVKPLILVQSVKN